MFTVSENILPTIIFSTSSQSVAKLDIVILAAVVRYLKFKLLPFSV